MHVIPPRPPCTVRVIPPRPPRTILFVYFLYISDYQFKLETVLNILESVPSVYVTNVHYVDWFMDFRNTFSIYDWVVGTLFFSHGLVRCASHECQFALPRCGQGSDALTRERRKLCVR